MNKDIQTIIQCQGCGLPDTFPGITFNDKQVCNYCAYHEVYKSREEIIKKDLKKEFIKVIDQVKQQNNKYDCIVAYSGGKDSTYLLNFLYKEFGLKILAHTFDNGFISDTAFKNMDVVTKHLGIDHQITKPKEDLLKKVFAYSLTENIPYPKEILSMMSQVCAACIGMVFGTTIYKAINLKIPLMFVGFTPGQYPAISLENFLKTGSCLFLSSKVYKDDPLDILKIIADPIREKFGSQVEPYFFKSQYYSQGMFVPKVLFPFHALREYDENEIYQTIYQLGWQKPKDTDSCSTNCLLNTLGNIASIKNLGYHPYAGEISYLVRQGKLTLDSAAKALKQQDNDLVKHKCLRFLGISQDQI